MLDNTIWTRRRVLTEQMLKCDLTKILDLIMAQSIVSGKDGRPIRPVGRPFRIFDTIIWAQPSPITPIRTEAAPYWRLHSHMCSTNIFGWSIQPLRETSDHCIVVDAHPPLLMSIVPQNSGKFMGVFSSGCPTSRCMTSDVHAISYFGQRFIEFRGGPTCTKFIIYPE
jgi:hypothetical protein